MTLQTYYKDVDSWLECSYRVQIYNKNQRQING